MTNLTFVDGPYGMNKYEGDVIRTSEAEALYRGVFERAAFEQSQHIIVCGTFDSLSWISEAHFVPSAYKRLSTVVWHKPDWVGGSIKSIKTFSPRHELLLHYALPDAAFDADAVRVPYGERAAKGVAKKTGRTHGWVPNPLGARRGDVWTICGERLTVKVDGRTQPNVHPCQKPTELLQILVASMVPTDGLVDEPFRGSASLESVCNEMNRRYRTWVNALDYVGGV